MGLALLLAAGGVFWWWTPGAGGGAARLVVDRTEIDLGALRYSTPATATFVISNAGARALELATSPVRAVRGC
jgi:hypothetical protein